MPEVLFNLKHHIQNGEDFQNRKLIFLPEIETYSFPIPINRLEKKAYKIMSGKKMYLTNRYFKGTVFFTGKSWSCLDKWERNYWHRGFWICKSTSPAGPAEATHTLRGSRIVCGSVENVPQLFNHRLWIPWSREWQPNPLQYSCLENPMDRDAWWATVHGVTKRQT